MLKWTPIPGAILAAIAIWGYLGFPTIATSGDINRLDRQQSHYAVELYNNKVRSLLAVKPPVEEPAASIWREEVEKAKRDRDAAERRALDLR